MWLFTFCIRRCFPNLTVVGDLTPSHGIRLAAPLEKALLRLGADIGLDFVGQYPNLDTDISSHLGLLDDPLKVTGSRIFFCSTNL